MKLSAYHRLYPVHLVTYVNSWDNPMRVSAVFSGCRPGSEPQRAPGSVCSPRVDVVRAVPRTCAPTTLPFPPLVLVKNCLLKRLTTPFFSVMALR